MQAFSKNLTRLAALPVLAAAAAFCLPAAAVPNNGVPGVDMNVSSHDKGGPNNNGVPGVDVSVSGKDQGSTKNKGVPGVDADVSASGASMDAGHDKTAAKSSRKMGASGTKTHGARADRN